ncbi:MAG: hypothetical protein ABIN91_24420 [Mucilaginibacter sp.]|uniref:hypothetical protein n=1 Tax=Mucilaginibacter sp. TaxID=1882438 RepID=UPI003265ED77
MNKILLLYSLITLSVVIYHPPVIKQGIMGKIYLRKGNYMPSPGQITPQGKPVKRTIYIYEVTNREQVTENGTHYSNIKTKLIAKTKSDDTGCYSIALLTGYYSVFVDDNDQIYANSFDGKGNINTIEVKKGKVSVLDIIINASNAVY